MCIPMLDKRMHIETRYMTIRIALCDASHEQARDRRLLPCGIRCSHVADHVAQLSMNGNVMIGDAVQVFNSVYIHIQNVASGKMARTGEPPRFFEDQLMIQAGCWDECISHMYETNQRLHHTRTNLFHSYLQAADCNSFRMSQR